MNEAVRWRLKGLGLAAVIFAFTLVNSVFGVQDLLHLLRGFSEQRPVITSSHYLGTMLALTPFGFGVGLLLLFAKKATPETMKRAAGKPSPWARRFLILVAVSIVAAFAAPILQYVVVDHIATGRGYATCPTPDWPRHQPDRWARPSTNCPGNGADPNE